ncbi:MAG: hypothetical protein KGL39_16705 [Patescibacteria group bacterium]|nr:hypothetical protein [Patescibacteria group bacterium]
MRINLLDRGDEFAWKRAISNQVNLISEGKQVGVYTASAAAPTTGTYALGDFVLNNNPSELGIIGAKYILHGWRCTAAGTPGTWVQCRFLTGS